MRAIVSSLAASFLSSSPSSPPPLNRHRGRTIGAATTALEDLLPSAAATRKKRLLLRLPCCIALSSSSSSSSFASGLTLTAANAFVPSPPTATARRSVSPLSTLSSGGMAPPQRKKQKRTSPSGKGSGDDGNGNGDDPAPTAFVIILSPAKTLDLECAGLKVDEPIPWTRPGHVDPARTRAIADRMRQHASSSPSGGLGKLLGVSAKIADAARSYWNDFDDGAVYRRLPCGFVLKGPAYQGLDLPSMAMAAGEEGGSGGGDVGGVAYLQRHLRIVDPVWGLLRPMDAIPPYRLEMATRNVLANDAAGGGKGKGTKLADYWKPAIQSALAKATEAAAEGTKGGSDGGGGGGDGNGTVVINLASDEYSAAVLPLPPPSSPGGGTSVKVVFRHQGRTVAVHAKRARGLFARFLAERRVATLEEFWDVAPEFAAEGYAHVEGESSTGGAGGDGDGGEWTVVYDRAAAPAKPKKKAK